MKNEDRRRKLKLDERKLVMDEFKEATLSHRFEAALMLGEITVYLAVVGSLLKETLGSTVPERQNLLAIGVAVITLTVAFFVINERAAGHMLAAINRALKLEEELGLSLYCGRPSRKTLWTGCNAARLIYLLGFVGGLWTFLRAI
jgi:uncharacterized membrane protein